MKLQRFVGANVREALQQVRASLGNDAMILSNKPSPEGVEIIAMPHSTAASIATPAAPVASPGTAKASPVAAKASPGFAATSPGTANVSPGTAVASSGMTAQPANAVTMTSAIGPDGPAVLRTRRRVDATATATAAPTPAIAPMTAPMTAPIAAPAAATAVASDVGPALAAELRTLRAIVERGFAALAPGDRTPAQPARGRLFGALVTAGFSFGEARRLSEQLPDDVPGSQMLDWVETVVARALRCVDGTEDLVARGGVYALVGPTGVGKTTTTAKLAARCVIKHGPQSIALITTDGYRIAAREQLRSYGRILGVDVHWIQDPESLQGMLSDLRHKHLVLIDTVGASQRDRKVADQLAMLAGTRIRRLLLLNAATQRETLEETVCVYAPAGLAGAILTKVDEAARIGGAVEVLMRNALPVHYVTNGQRVPEDIGYAEPRHLAKRALAARSGAPAARSDAPAAEPPLPAEAMPDWLAALPAGSPEASWQPESAHA